MGRRIVLLSDGTGNSAAKVWRTNIWRVFESLDLSGDQQIAFYDDGVGTASFKPLAILGGAFGYGLKRNVIDIYKFACRNYRSSDDEIFGFGFSRGAFTMRIVIGLIMDQGLVDTRGISEAELHARAKAAYRAFRKNFHTAWPAFLRPETLIRAVRDLFSRDDTARHRADVEINVRFLGLWDTVAAYGMPVEEMAVGFSRWIWPWILPDCVLHPGIQRACHALSVDDERTTFHPTLWDESAEQPLKPRPDGTLHLCDERISQVWFPGVHSNVGGGYPDDSVAQIPLVWILSEARTCGLLFKSTPFASPQTEQHPGTAQDKDGRLYDPRRGLGGYYRYGPRDILALGRKLLRRQGQAVTLPRIHESVLKRVKNRAHAYAPIGLPEQYELVTYGSEVVAPPANPYETPPAAQARWRLQQDIWNLVWLRRVVYFLTVAVSCVLFAFPLVKGSVAQDEFSSPIRWLSDIIRMVAAFLPSGADTWVDAYARSPGVFVALVALLSVMIAWGAKLAGRIESRMGLVWRGVTEGTLTAAPPPSGLLYRIRTSDLYVCGHAWVKNTAAPAFFALVFVWLGLTLLSHAVFNVADDAGLVCRERHGPVTELARGDIVLANGRSADAHEYLARRRELRQLLAGNSAMPQQVGAYLTDKINNDPLSSQERSELMQAVRDLPVFETSNFCQSMQVTLERGRTYRIRFDSTASFVDKEIPASGGFYTWEAPWRSAPFMFLALPLRRELIRPWFRVVARYGGKGGEETFLDPDPIRDKQGNVTGWRIDQVIKPTRAGELFLFVNDAVIALPWIYDVFYRNNKGSTRVLIIQEQ